MQWNQGDGMPGFGTKYAFLKPFIDQAPEGAGVYTLYDGDEVIYIGRAQGGSVTIRSRLLCHYAGQEKDCTRRATAFRCEEVSDPIAREVELLTEFQRVHVGKLPRCNKRIG